MTPLGGVPSIGMDGPLLTSKNLTAIPLRSTEFGSALIFRLVDDHMLKLWDY